MRKLDWIIFALIALSLFYTWMGFGIWREWAAKTVKEIAADIKALEGRAITLEEQWRIYLETPEEKEKKPEPNFDYWSD